MTDYTANLANINARLDALQRSFTESDGVISGEHHDEAMEIYRDLRRFFMATGQTSEFETASRRLLAYGFGFDRPLPI